MSEFEKRFPIIEVDNQTKMTLRECFKEGWLGALKWAKGQGCTPASILEREIEELEND